MNKKRKPELLQVILLGRHFWPWIIGISVAITLSSLLRQIPPQIQRGLIDYLTEGQLPTWFGITLTFSGTLVAFLVVTLLNTILDRIQRSLTGRFDTRFRFYLRQQAYDQLLKLSIPYYNRNRSGSLMSKIDRGASQVSSAVRNIASNILPNILTAIVSVIIVASIQWQIAVSAIIGFIIYFSLRQRKFKLVEKIDKKIHNAWDKEAGHFYEAISSIRLVKSFASEDHEFAQYKKFSKKVTNLSDQRDKVENQFVFANIFLSTWFWGIFAYIFYLGLNQGLSIGTVILLIQYTNIIRQPFTSIEFTFWEIKRAQTGSRDYLKILNAKDYTPQTDQPIISDKITGEIKFNNVAFTYPEKGGQNVFENFNLNINSGKTLAVVGKSGAGKTTLAHLLIRFFDPSSGTISIDGHDIRDLSLTQLRNNIGLVMQQNYLFADTIEENLRYGKPDATLKEMKVACHIANADVFINKLHKGYKTKIGERGVKLSGGQQQRLSIARTILKNPPILILDEATSSLDSHSEKLVQDAVWKLIRGRTAIIIAHRLSTIQKADKIIVLGKKKIIEQGTHSELIKKKNGIYNSLHLIQSGQLEKLKNYELTS